MGEREFCLFNEYCLTACYGSIKERNYNYGLPQAWIHHPDTWAPSLPPLSTPQLNLAPTPHE